MSQHHLKVEERLFANAQFLPEVVKLLNEGHTVTLKLKGFSMRPFLEDGRDKALLTPYHQDRRRPRDAAWRW